MAEGVSSRVEALLEECSHGGTDRPVLVVGHPLALPGGALVHPVWLFVWMHTLLVFQCSSVQALGGNVVEHRRQEGGARVVRGARGGWHWHMDASNLVRGAHMFQSDATIKGQIRLVNPNISIALHLGPSQTRIPADVPE